MKKLGLVLVVAVALVANASTPAYQLGYDVATKAAVLEFQKKEVKNTLTSPYSLHAALSMATSGAAKDSLVLLLAKLGAEDRQALVAANASVQKLLKRTAPADSPKNRPKSPTMNISNSIWRTTGATDGRRFVFSDDFLKDMGRYEAETRAEDFKTEDAANEINEWVTLATNKMITKVIDQEGLDPLLWAIINAIYLEGNWEKPFYHKSTRGPNFTKIGGDGIQVEMMQTKDDFRHAVTTFGEAVELPLFGSQFAFVALLPKDDSEFAKTGNPASIYDSAAWTEVLAELEKAEEAPGTIDLPKFKYEYGYEMRPDDELTKASGLNPLFKSGADFSRMGTKDSLPSEVALLIHKTAIEVDEYGLKAAAVTLIGGGERGMIRPQQPPFEMEFKRPFLYSIVDRETGAILFLGSVVDPTLAK